MSNVPATKNDIRSMIQSDTYQQEFKNALPKHLTPERLTRVALTALTKTPKLMNCTQASLMSCILDCAAFGIEPDGRRAHLIPYGDKCTLIIDYKGLAELAMRSGMVSSIHTDIVCENDLYEENMGQIVKHKINRKKPRGEPYAAYSHVVMKDGTDSFQIMSKDEIDGIRKRSKSGSNGPWVTDTGEMWKKTVFRRHSKWLPLSPEFRDALDKDDTMPRDIGAEVEICSPKINEPDMSAGKPVEKKAMDTPSDKPKKGSKKAKKEPEAVGPTPDTDSEPEEPVGADAEPQDASGSDDDGFGGPFAAPIVKNKEVDTP